MGVVKPDIDSIKDLLDDAVGLYKNLYRAQFNTKQDASLIAQACHHIGMSLGLLCREIAQRELMRE